MQLRSRQTVATSAAPETAPGAAANPNPSASASASASTGAGSTGKRKRRLSLAATAPATLTLSQESQSSDHPTDAANPVGGARLLKRPATATLASTSNASIHQVTRQVKDAKAKKKFVAAKKRKLKEQQQQQQQQLKLQIQLQQNASKLFSTSAAAVPSKTVSTGSKPPIVSRAKAAAKAKATMIDIVPPHHLLSSPVPNSSLAPAAIDTSCVSGDAPLNTSPTRASSRRLSSRFAQSQSASVPPPLPPPLILAAASSPDPTLPPLTKPTSKKRTTPPSPGPESLLSSPTGSTPAVASSSSSSLSSPPSPRKKRRRDLSPSVLPPARPATPPNTSHADADNDDRMSIDTPVHSTSSRPHTPMDLDPPADPPPPHSFALPPLRSALKKKPPTSTISSATPPISRRSGNSPASATKVGRKKVGATVKFRTRAIQFSSEPPQVFEVLGTDEYDRKVSDTDWWIMFENNQVSHPDAVRVYWELDMYKLYEMGPSLPSPAPDTSSSSNMRFDLVTTPAQRASLLNDFTYAQALALTLPEIQARLDSLLYEYDPGYQLAAPVLADLWDQLVEMVAPFADILDRVSPPTAPAPGSPPQGGGAFDVPEVWAKWSHIVPDLCALSLDQVYAQVKPNVPKALLLDQVASLYLMHFVRPSRPPQEEERTTFAKLVVMAVGGVRPQLPPPPPPPPPGAGRGKKAVRGRGSGNAKAKAKGGRAGRASGAKAGTAAKRKEKLG